MATFLAILQALPEALRLLNAVLDFARVQEAKGVGRTEAVNEGLRLAMQQVAEAAEAEREAQAAHAASDDDSAFDRDFERRS